MELEESIKLLEEKIEKGKELDTRNNPMSDIIDEIIIENKAIDRLIKYIKEESIPKAVVEEKIKVVQERIKEETRIDFLITLKILENELQEILNKGE